MASGKSLLTSKSAIYGVIITLLSASLMGAAHNSTSLNIVYSVAASSQNQAGIELADGDLVFRTGRDIMARLVLSQGDSPRFSHVGVIVKRGNDIFVVHALPRDDKTSHGGVLIEPLASFTSPENAEDIGFFRIKGIRYDSRRRIRDYAMQQIGKPFDDEFRFSDDARMYCTELVMKALAAGGFDLSQSIQHLTVMLLSEPVIPPDYLRRSAKLETLIPSPSFHALL